MERLIDRLLRDIHERGPLTVAAFMECALYDPDDGYYAAGRRSGARGDFYTSADAGPSFGHLLSRQITRMWQALGQPLAFDLVEVGASDGRLMQSVLDALATEAPAAYAAALVTLVERGRGGRAEHERRLHSHRARLAASTDVMPVQVRGVILGNELLDAFPVHRVVVTDRGLREVYVTVRDGHLATVLGPVSSDEVARYFTFVDVTPSPGLVADISPAAVAWVRGAARALSDGYLLLVDYGREARQLFGETYRAGTLRAYHRHLVDAPPPARTARTPAWLERPGEQDLTADVDFTAVRRAAECEGLSWCGSMPQARWLLDLGLGDLLERASDSSLAHVRQRLRLRSLVLPGGPGSSHHVLVMARGEGLPSGIP